MSVLSQQKQSVNTDFPNVRPSLDLRFALAKKLDPRVTFSRGSVGTYVGSDGLIKTASANEPRFDHDPVTGQSLGLLIEESRQNLLTYSNGFDDASWTKTGLTVTPNAAVAPDGTLTAYLMTETSSNVNHNLTVPQTFTPNNYVISIFVKQGTGSRFYAISGFGLGVINEIPIFDISNGILYTPPTTTIFKSASIIPYPNGWYRCICSVASTVSTTAPFFNRRKDITFGNVTFVGDGTSSMYFWGAQLEIGTFPTSYIPTTASTVTRNPDNASMTGTNFSSWYNQNEGTIYLETDKLNSGNFDEIFRTFYAFTDSTQSNTILSYVLPSSTSITNYGIANGGRQVFNYVTLNIGSSPTKFKFGQSLNSKYSFFTSSKATSSPQLPSKSSPEGQNLSIPTNLTQLSIGSEYTSFFQKHINSHISRFTYYPIQLTNQQLINLTS